MGCRRALPAPEGLRQWEAPAYVLLGDGALGVEDYHRRFAVGTTACSSSATLRVTPLSPTMTQAYMSGWATDLPMPPSKLASSTG